jgi:hypothetical protein
MSRLVRRDVRLGNSLLGLHVTPVRAQIATVAPAVADQGAGAATETDTDDYATRMVKYIPAEVVAFYLAADKLFANVAAPANPTLADTFVAKNQYYFSLGIFVVALVSTPLYLRQQADDGGPWQVQAAVSTIAFAIWSYAVHGELFVPLYSSSIAALLVLVFTFVSGLVKPGR